MTNVTPISPENLTPEIVLQSVLKEVQNARAMYVVLILKEGEPSVYTCGRLEDLCYASQSLNTVTQRYLRGEVEDI